MRGGPHGAPACSLTALAGAVLAASAGLGGCANVSPPPGGPADTIPPALLSVTPDSQTVMPRFRDRVVFSFDETISERDIQAAVTLYPLERRPDVDKGKRELKVKPRAGWVPDRIYHVRVNPVVQDLFSNRIPRPIDYVFSTGAPLTQNAVAGTVTDRLTGRPLPRGRVDMVTLPDTLVYGAELDSAGTFALATLPASEYLAIGYEDLNGNSRADDFDRSDTARVTLGAADTLALDFSVFKHDTVGPSLSEVQPIDSVTLALGFDTYLDPDVPLDTSMVEVFSLAANGAVPLEAVMHDWRYRSWRDSLAAARAAERDTLPPDTAGPPGARPDTSPPPRRAPRPGGLVGGARGGGQAADTTAVQVIGRLPAQRIYVITRGPIPAGEVRVRASGIVNLSGLVGGGELTYEQPARQEPTEEQEGGPGGPGG